MPTFEQVPNPFTVQTPESMKAEDVIELFVDVFSDFPTLLREGHVFLHGPRGSGKSMMFRFMLPDCQTIKRKCAFRELDYLAIYIPIKETEFQLAELTRLDQMHGAIIINEHMMVSNIMDRIFQAINDEVNDEDSIKFSKHMAAFYNDIFLPILEQIGWKDNRRHDISLASGRDHIIFMRNIFLKLFSNAISYIRRLSFNNKPISYENPLCGYLDVAFPIIKNLKSMPFMPSCPIYLLIDDADNLSLSQTKILNTWVSSRTTSDLSIKASTQLGYKTWVTISGQRIDTPHDFAEVNISAIYTASAKDTYRQRLGKIINKRLNSHVGREVEPEDFFPSDIEQEKKISLIVDQYKEQTDDDARGARAADDAYRYSRPDFMKSLVGSSKSGPTYSYSGFNQLVNISSGIVRQFLEPAARMFNEMKRRNPLIEAIQIPPGIQNEIIREFSDEFFLNEFDRLLEDASIGPSEKSLIYKLRNLIRALGGTFKNILLSNRSERRVFSVAISDEADEEVIEVFKFGAQRGFFHISVIGNKEGTGRTPLYILNRTLAPHFYLDPTSFAGYLFATNAAIKEAMENPARMLRKIDLDGIESFFEPRQLSLF